MSDSNDSVPVHVILGATSAIASATARRLRKSGARLLLCGRNTERLESLAGDLDAPSRVFEATDPESIAACFDDANERWGAVDGALCCVGSIVLKPAHLTKDDVWRETMALNLDAAFYTLREAAKRMQRNGGGSVVLMSSAAARHGLPNHEAIAAAKAGVDGMVRAAASTYGARKIRVNSVAPGLVETPMSAALTRNEKSREASESMHALGRLGTPQDVAPLIAWLLGPESSWVTGQTLGVDGGLGVALRRG